jgi:hypothetical protein
VVNGSAKMWSNVQSDQSTQNDSLNVSSNSDQGTGACRRNLASAFANNPFTHAGLSVEQPNSAGFSKFTSVSSSAVETSVRNTSNSAHDKENSCIAIGDLA